MRKITTHFKVIAGVLVLLLLVACGPQNPPSAPVEFIAQAEIHFGNSTFEAQITQQRPGNLEVEFIAPPELVGMQISLQGESAIVHHDELQSEFAQSVLPASNFVVLLNAVLLRLAQPNLEGFTQGRDGSFTLQGTQNGLQYRAVISAEGMLEQLQVPAASLEVILLPN